MVKKHAPVLGIAGDTVDEQDRNFIWIVFLQKIQPDADFPQGGIGFPHPFLRILRRKITVIQVGHNTRGGNIGAGGGFIERLPRPEFHIDILFADNTIQHQIDAINGPCPVDHYRIRGPV